jgi:arsenate reductase-like glutaredoxin family protein
MSEEFTESVYIDGKLVAPKAFNKKETAAKGITWEGSWEQACTKTYSKNKYLTNREHIKARVKEYATANKEVVSARNRVRYLDNIEKCKKDRAEWRKNNKEAIAAANKKRWQLKKDELKAKHADYYTKNKDTINKKSKEYRTLNRDRKAECDAEYQRARLANDSNFRFAKNVRCLVKQSFKRSTMWSSSKPAKTHNILGCTMPELLVYVTLLFADGMSLENYGHGIGKWVLDHIIPIKAAQDLAGSDEEFQCFVVILNHHTNLRPMWWEENSDKSGVYDVCAAKKFFGLAV